MHGAGQNIFLKFLKVKQKRTSDNITKGSV